MPTLHSTAYTLLTCCCCALSAAADEFPYSAYVAANNTEVVAGPGHRYYATDKLSRGAKVEIYREEASGWLAIRPPAGAFSWVPADFVERLDDAQGRVTKSTGAWVGTSVEHVEEHHQQTTLKVGELVNILGEKSAASVGGKDQTWLKIAPPAGEYRWIHLRDVSRQKPADPPPSTEHPADEPKTEAAEAERQKSTDRPKFSRHVIDQLIADQLIADQLIADQLIADQLIADQHVEPAQYRSTQPSTTTKTLSPDGFVPRKRSGGDQIVAPTARPNLDPADRFASAATRPSSTSPQSSTRTVGNDAISRQLDEIEVDLSLMLAKDRSQWDLQSIKRRVESLVESAADPVARGRARLVLEKVKQFEDIFDARAVASKTASPSAISTSSKPDPLADPRYDAQGWLKPVVSKKSSNPIAPYAIVDAEGQPVCFISPSPGLNLNRYLNKQVGLYGRRGYLEELKKPHLVAERIIELDSRLR